MSKEFNDKLDDFSRKIEYVRRGPMGVPKILTIDLAVVAVDHIYDVSGNIFYIWSAPDESSYISIKVNETSQPAIAYSVHTGLETPFHRLIITTPAGQAGNIVLIYGTEAPELLRLIDNRSTTVAGVGGVLDELRGDLTPENWGAEVAVGVAAVQLYAANVVRKSAIIQSKQVNAGLVYVGFDNTVGPTIWVAELQAGMAFSIDDYRGPLWAEASIAGQLVGGGEW